MSQQNPQPNNTPTLRFDSEGHVQIVFQERPAFLKNAKPSLDNTPLMDIPRPKAPRLLPGQPTSATLIYVSTHSGDAHLVILRLSLPGRRLYLIANPSLPAHRAAVTRLAGQRVVRIVDNAGIPLATVYQPEGARRHLSHLISAIPAPERPYNALEWAKLVSDTQLRLPAAAEIPADLEGYQPG